ncbi:ImmA/IrrE family metallo-endopeptidase [Propioniciclava sp. MC1683]|uniref:helix-turn-helix domain-containing protein n=1 Tax=Propioniciclava sp. MC1683 TaxID=2760309 RepID=UPI0016017E49|nr:XRE family transcriptional regulator [Propioniciclava sp. MC1683]MBB1503079.1 ImmA/IrrE family metallo-endopeptidase [Propioniciclava sp. MC1683]
MDKVEIGQRLAIAREVAGMTQDSVGAAVGLDRTAIGLIEKGTRNVKVGELLKLAEVLGRPVAFFVEPAIPAVVSRRQSPTNSHETTKSLDLELQHFASDVREMVSMGVFTPSGRDPDARTPRTVKQAENAASRFRRQLGGDPAGPLPNLSDACEQLGLYLLATPLGAQGADGGCVEVETDVGVAGVAVINSDKDLGRRRMTTAHELGHWLFGDAYDTNASLDAERMVNAFAIHFLAPRPGVERVWQEVAGRTERDRAATVATEFQLSWSAAIAQLRNLNLVDFEQHDLLLSKQPTRGDFLRLGLQLRSDLDGVSLPTGFVAACLDAYAHETLTPARVLQVLRGTVSSDELPDPGPASPERWQGAFLGHPRR